MDRISDSNGIIWLFLGIMLYCLLTVIFTFGIWVKSEKVSKFFYPAGVTVNIIILFCDIQIVFFSAAYEPAFLLFLVYGRVFTIMGVVMLCVSIIFQKRNNKIMRNIFLNLSTVGGLVLFVYLMQVK